MKDVPRITEAEWQVMNVVWESPPVTAQDVTRELANDQDWSSRTVKTFLARLVKKGVLEYEVEGKRYLYSPRVSREESLAVEGRSLLGRLRGAPVSPLMAWFVEHSSMDRDEIESLKRMLDEKEEEL